MSAKANPTLVGLFVVGAFALAVTGIALFGGGRLFSSRVTYVMYFDGSIGGLQVGAPVNFRGVRLGQVTNIVIRYLPQSGTPRFVIPVYVQVEPGRIQRDSEAARPAIEELIDLGLRAQLGMQSFVTGQLSVELDFVPGQAAQTTGLDHRYVEIPTVPSDAEKLKASATRLADVLQDLPLEDITRDIKTAVTAASNGITVMGQTISKVSDLAVPLVEDVSATVTDVRALVQDARNRIAMQQGEVLWSANESMAKLDTLLVDLDSRLAPLSASAQATLDALRAAAGDASSLMGTANTRIDPLTDDLQRALAAATAAFDQAQTLLRTLEAQATPLIAEIQSSLTVARETLVLARQPIQDAGHLAATLDAEVAPLAAEARATLVSARTAVDDAGLAIDQLRSLIGTVDDGVRPIMAKAVTIVDDAGAAVAEARLALTGISTVVRPGAPSVTRVDAALRQVELAARSVQNLADFLQRNPNALILGR